MKKGNKIYMDDRINSGLLRHILDADGCDTPVCNMCEDKRRSWGLEGYPLAMVYSPVQRFENMYDLDTALAAGTLFKALDLPFMGMTVTKGGYCRG